MSKFEDGYEFFYKNTPYIRGSIDGAIYVGSVEKEINQLNNNINSFIGKQSHVKQLKGNVFEFWHSGTYNIDSVVHGATGKTSVDGSNDLGSVDISSNFGEVFGLKDYQTPIESAKQQTKTHYEKYREYVSKNKSDISFEDYLEGRNLSGTDPNLPMYYGQMRVIPKDQLEEAIKWLKRQIENEKTIRPEQVNRYEDTLKNLTDKLKSPDGVESISLSKADSEIIAGLAKEGAFDASNFGLTTEKLIQYNYVLNQALKAGTSAAMITTVLKVAPEIYKAIELLIFNGEIDEKQFQKIGFAALNGAAEGFIRGTVAASITTAFKAGLWGACLKSVDPILIGASTAIVMNTLRNSFDVATGKMTRVELADACARDLFLTACSLTLGGVTQGMIQIPVLGFALGSFVGSVVGSFAYNKGYTAYMSFCVDSGFTFFGLVDQDYTLPTEVLTEMGIDVFEYDKFEPRRINIEGFEPQQINIEKFKPQTIAIKTLRRGVIEVNRIGYV